MNGEERVNLSISVMAHHSRSAFFPYLQERLGVPLSQFSIDTENNLLKNCKSAWRLHDPSADFHVVIQDDAIVCDDFHARAIEFITKHENRRIKENLPEQGYNFFLKLNDNGTPLRLSDGYYTSNVTRGGVAICLPVKHIEPMLEEFDRQFSRHDDDRISAYITKNNMRMIFPVPSLIDHRSELDSLAGNKRSLSAYNYIDRKPLTIPKIIHQLWVGNKPRPDKWMRTWQMINPDWEYRVWDNNAVKATKWVNQKHIDYYFNRQIWHGVSDVCTYEILFNHGGVMVGADAVCEQPIDELFTDGFDAYGVYENEKVRPGLISPLLASVKGGKFAAELIEGLRQKERVGEPWLTTGNKYMGEMYEKTKQNVKIFPSHYFNPEHFTGEKYDGNDKIYARQKWGTTRQAYDEGTTGDFSMMDMMRGKLGK